MKLRAACVVVGFFSLLLSLVPVTVAQTTAETASALPRLVRFGGIVKDLNGNPLTGVVGITFALYSEQSGGAALWLETQNVTADSNGHYVAVLGSSTPDGLPAEIFTSEQARWVGVQVSGQAEQPRVLLVSAPYALKAGDAETIGGLPPSAFVLANQGTAGGVKNAVAPASANAQKNSAPPANPNVTGKGVVDFIPMWDTTSDIVDSIIFQKSSEIGIHTTTPAATLDVNGKTDVRDTLTLFPKSTDSTLAISGTTFKVDQSGKVTFITGQTFPGTGTITGITTATGSGLSGGGTTGTLSLKVPAAGITNAMLANPSFTLTAGGGMAGGGSVSLGGTTTLGLKTCSANQVLQYVSGVWTCSNAGTGTVTSVGSGAGLTGGPITGTGTLSVDTTKVPLLGAANTFVGNQAVTGNMTASGQVQGGVVNATTSFDLGGIPFASGSSSLSTTFLGFFAGVSTTQSFNTGIGSGALYKNTTGANNVAIGDSALTSNTTGGGNTADGSQALYANNGSSNTGVGDGALGTNTTGSYNTALGWNAGNPTNGAPTTGVDNTFIGANAIPGTQTNLTNATAIGANAEVTESNALVLGSIAGLNGAGVSVNVGIGTTAPPTNLTSTRNRPRSTRSTPSAAALHPARVRTAGSDSR